MDPGWDCTYVCETSPLWPNVRESEHPQEHGSDGEVTFPTTRP